MNYYQVILSKLRSSLIQETTPLQTSGSIYNIEKALVGGKTFYKVAISKGTTMGKFQAEVSGFTLNKFFTCRCYRIERRLDNWIWAYKAL